ncbi:MAG TPA: ABC transporter substrate-binding protein [Dongiaceae bacterium]|jgi:NitT/TauT family transport system substrate-binding protein|nr:ABC transporter substrate-binding protein [Dongiaceae bacterium]
MKRKARWVVQAQSPRRFSRRGFAAAIFLLAAAPVYAPAVAEDVKLTPIVVALPEGPSGRTIGYHLAKAGGWFAREGLDPELVTADQRGPMGMVADGDADLAIDIMPHALTARADGADIVHVAQIFQKSGLVLVCRHPIKEPKDLKGMNVALWSGGQESPFYAWMEKVGLGIYGEADGVTILREGLDPESYRNRGSDCFSSESYALPQQLALQGKTSFDYRVFSYEEVGTATLEDGVYARAEDVKDRDKVARIAHFLAGARAGWQNAAAEARKAADFLADIIKPPAPDLATLLRSIWAANDLVAVNDVTFGHLDPAAYDRTVTILLTAAPDPVLKTAPLSAVSDAAIKVLDAQE